MPVFLLFLVRFVRLLLSGHQDIAIENAALQLAAFRRKRKPDTVVRWERERFRRFWARVSRVDQRRPSRPATVIEVRRLIERMVAANPRWRAPRLHGELQMLGIQISERTVSRILRRLRRPPTQTWRTFLHNHLGQMVSIDFFTVPTVTLRVLFVFVVLEHRRRQVLHFNMTEHLWSAKRLSKIKAEFANSSGTRYGMFAATPFQGRFVFAEQG